MDPIMKFASVAVIMSSVMSCGREGNDLSVPKPEGFARIEIYPEAYSPLEGISQVFHINDSAQVVENRGDDAGNRWITLGYPRYGALVYLTFTPTSSSSVGRVVENRLERMALNAGNATSELMEFTGKGGFKSKLMSTRSVTVTPLQFLSVAPDLSVVVSGTLFIDGADAASSPDSVAPIVNAVTADMIYSLTNAFVK